MFAIGTLCVFAAFAAGQSDPSAAEILEQVWAAELQSAEPNWSRRQQLALQFERAGLHDKAMSVLDHIPAGSNDAQQLSRAKGLHQLIRFHVKAGRQQRALDVFGLMAGNPPSLAAAAPATYPVSALMNMNGKIDDVGREKVAAVWTVALAEPKSPEQTDIAMSIIAGLKPATYRDKLRHHRLDVLVWRLKRLEEDQRDTIETKRLTTGIRKWLADFETTPLIQLRRFGKTLASYGKVDPVVSLAEQLLLKAPQDDHSRFVASDLLIAAAGVEYEAGNANESAKLVSKAQTLFERVPDEVRKYWHGELSFAMGLAKAGHQEEAIQASLDDAMPGYMTDVCATIYHPGHPIEWILNQRVSQQKFDDALALAEQFTQHTDQLRAKAMVAKGLADAGRTERAERLLAELEQSWQEKNPRIASDSWPQVTLPLEASMTINAAYTALAIASGKLADPKDKKGGTWGLSTERKRLIAAGEQDRVLKALDDESVTAEEVLDFAKTGHPAIAMSLMERFQPMKWGTSKPRVLAKIATAAIQHNNSLVLKQALAALDDEDRMPVRSALISACVGPANLSTLKVLLDEDGPDPLPPKAAYYIQVEEFDEAMKLARNSKQLSSLAHSLLYKRKYDAAIRFAKSAPNSAARANVIEMLCRELAELKRLKDAESLVAMDEADKPTLQLAIASGLLDGEGIPKLWRGLQRDDRGHRTYVDYSLHLLNLPSETPPAEQLR